MHVGRDRRSKVQHSRLDKEDDLAGGLELGDKVLDGVGANDVGSWKERGSQPGERDDGPTSLCLC